MLARRAAGGAVHIDWREKAHCIITQVYSRRKVRFGAVRIGTGPGPADEDVLGLLPGLLEVRVAEGLARFPTRPARLTLVSFLSGVMFQTKNINTSTEHVSLAAMASRHHHHATVACCSTGSPHAIEQTRLRWRRRVDGA